MPPTRYGRAVGVVVGLLVVRVGRAVGSAVVGSLVGSEDWVGSLVVGAADVGRTDAVAVGVAVGVGVGGAVKLPLRVCFTAAGKSILSLPAMATFMYAFHPTAE